MTTATVKAFDAAEFLDNDEVIAAYLQDALEDEDPDVFILAVADVVKARSMTRLAEDSGLGRTSLYKTIAPGAKPGFATIGKLLGALGVKFQVTPAKKVVSPVKKVAKVAAKAPSRKVPAPRKRATA